MVGDEWISRDIGFQMTGAAERKEREPKFVLEGVPSHTQSHFMTLRQESAGQKSEGNGPIDIMNVRRKIFMRVYTEGFVCHSGQLETYSAVNRTR